MDNVDPNFAKDLGRQSSLPDIGPATPVCFAKAWHLASGTSGDGEGIVFLGISWGNQAFSWQYQQG